jgi:hypothetical protein
MSFDSGASSQYDYKIEGGSLVGYLQVVHKVHAIRKFENSLIIEEFYGTEDRANAIHDPSLKADSYGICNL